MLSAACLKPLRESAYSQLYKSQYNFTSTPFDIHKLIEDAGQLSCVAFAWHLTRMQKTTLTATLVASGINVRTGLLSACPSMFYAVQATNVGTKARSFSIKADNVVQQCSGRPYTNANGS